MPQSTELLSKIQIIRHKQDGKIFRVLEWRWGCVRIQADSACYEEPINWLFWSKWEPDMNGSGIDDITPSLIPVGESFVG